MVDGSAVGWALQLSYDLDGVWDRSTYLSVVGRAIDRVLPGDSGGLVSIDPGLAGVTVVGDPHGAVRSDVVRTLRDVMVDHPQFRSYAADPEDLSPRRISDVISDRQWRRHRVYHELFVPMGATFHISLPVTPIRLPGGGAAWTVNRSRPDFSDRECEVAKEIQPTLMVLDRVSRMGGRRQSEGGLEAADRARLTARELTMLGLLARGFTADHISHVERISVNTVRKHLQNAYAKLGCHDRLLAVQRVRELGLI